MTASGNRSGFPWLLSLVALLMLGILASLGTWQVRRLAWKEDLIRSAEAAAGAAVLTLDQALRLENPEFRQVLVTCPGLSRAPFVELQSIESGQSGSRLVSACEWRQGRTILVDRGFIPDGATDRPLVQADDRMPGVVHGVLRRVPAPGPMVPPPSERRFYARDLPAMAKDLEAEGRVESFTLYALTRTSPGLPALTPSVPPVAFSNNHLGYALTWFGLAIALIVFYVVLLRRRLTAKENRP